MTMRFIRLALFIGVAAIATFAPAQAKAQAQPQSERERRTVDVQPYIEVSQIVTAELSPGDEVLTVTQLAAGVDINAQGRNSGASVSVRYERNIGYGDAVEGCDFAEDERAFASDLGEIDEGGAARGGGQSAWGDPAPTGRRAPGSRCSASSDC